MHTDQVRVVIKIGSSSLTLENEGLNMEQIRYFASELAALRAEGLQVLLVTSGAVAAGFTSLGYKARPKLLHEKQASASIGQTLLMQAYHEALAKYGIGAAQILLTRSDFTNRKCVHNASMTIDELLHRGVIPIINENDTISVDEIKFGDNDTLSALVANLVKAQKLIILTDIDGLYTDNPRNNPLAKRIDHVDEITDELYQIAGGAGSAVGTGGMRTKIEAARIGMRGGVSVFVGRSYEPGDLMIAYKGNGKGTYFDAKHHNLSMKKQWVGFHSVAAGTIIVDQGAEKALLNGGKSLLPAGVTQVEGDFHPGDVVEVRNVQGECIGRGIVNYTPWQIQAVAGHSSEEVTKRIEVSRIEVIHRDEWVTLQSYKS
ncbi:glutamate 5-kinase [Paenibacillus sp. N1-5-1-14]|uniref:glutamate 5-kinase n=1 Tax=Paenibacillus radicibacter TaxID=2972488 RepID=UPI0021594148|nr:glutamate 5-kinase [Paenibacillus radicibacter]MCR8642226.1 glutamate 5-kinase [Paenibacillus radicibacter]